MRPSLSSSICSILTASWLFIAPASAATVANAGDASISHDPQAGTWTMGDGIDLIKSPNTAAHILILVAKR